MKFLAIDKYDEETGQAFRVSINPRHILHVATYYDDDRNVMCTFEMINEGLIELILAEEDAAALMISLHKADQPGGEYVFKDIRTKKDDEE